MATKRSKYMISVDEAVEHHVLLAKVGMRSNDIDKCFRIVLDDEGADWTFVCPMYYRGISDKVKRMSAFYKDGFRVISDGMDKKKNAVRADGRIAVQVYLGTQDRLRKDPEGSR